MAECLVTTLRASADNAQIRPAEELVIRVNSVDPSVVPSSGRYIWFAFRKPATVRIEINEDCSSEDLDGNSIQIYNASNVGLGTEVSANANTATTLYFPIPKIDSENKSHYNIVVSDKYSLYQLNTSEYPVVKYDFFEFDIKDLAYCPLLYSLRCMCHRVSGDLSSLKYAAPLNYLQISRTEVSGDIKSLESCASLQYFKAAYSDVRGDIGIVQSLPNLLHFESSGCLEICGDLAAFEDHPSIYYIQLPQVSGHPAVSGSISSLENCTSLVYLYAANESNITGDISALEDLSSLQVLNLSGTGVSGDVEALSGLDNLTTVNLGVILAGGNVLSPFGDRINGSVSAFAGKAQLASLTLANTGVSGDVEGLTSVPSLGILNLANTQVEGDIAAFSPQAMPALRQLDLSNCAGISGDVASLEGTQMTSLLISRTNVTGDIGEALENCTTLTSVNFSSTGVTGDVTKVFAGTSVQTGSAANCTGLEGDLAQLPEGFYYFMSTGFSGSTFSWQSTRPSTSLIVALDNVDLGDDVEAMLINQASCTPKKNVATYLHKRISVVSSSVTALGSSAKAACATLAEKGFTVIFNGSTVAV